MNTMFAVALPLLGRALLCAALLVASLPGAGCRHPERAATDRANELGEAVYVTPQAVALDAAREIEALLRELDNPRIRSVGTSEDEQTGVEIEVTKYRRDFYWDRNTMALCQNYLTLGRANVAMEAYEAAQQAFHQAIEASNHYVGQHIQYVMDSSPEVFRTIKAYFRSKKVETVAYVHLRDLARAQGNEALATVYDLRARYAKMYLDSRLAIEEMDSVKQWEWESSRQDDRQYIATVWLVIGIIVVLGLWAFGYERWGRNPLGTTAVTLAAAALIAVMIYVYVEQRRTIDQTTIRDGLGELNQFLVRIRDIPELNNLPSFEEFRRAVEETQRLADEGDSAGAATAFLQSYLHLADAEADLTRLRERYRSASEGTVAANPTS